MVVSVGVGFVESRLGLVLGFGGNGGSEWGWVEVMELRYLGLFFLFYFSQVVVVGMCRKHIILLEYITK